MQSSSTVVLRKWRSIRSKSTGEQLFLLTAVIFLFFLFKFLAFPSQKQDFELSMKQGLDGKVQDDPSIIEHLSFLILAPSWDELKLKEPKKEDYSDHGQSMELAKILKNLEYGFFIEANAGDGEKGSVSLYFERKLHWFGLLIEEDFDNFQKMLDKERYASTVHAKLATTRTIEVVKRFSNSNGTTDTWFDPIKYHWEIPFFAFYAVMGNTFVDLLILDTMGTELQVLRTIPWEKVTIRVLCVAYTHIPGNSRALPEYLSSKGYTLLKTHIKDMFFVSKEYLESQKENKAR